MEENLKTTRQKEIYKLLVAGLSNKEIAAKMFVEEPSIKCHVTMIYKICNVKCRPQLIAKHYQTNWIEKERPVVVEDTVVRVPEIPDILPKLEKNKIEIELPVGISGLTDEVCEHY